MSKHKSSPWTSFGVFVSFGNGNGVCLRDAPYPESSAKIVAAAPELYKELACIVDTEEQSCFEQWLSRSEPSGDCDLVHAQWLESSDYQDFCELWSGPISAIAKARGES